MKLTRTVAHWRPRLSVAAFSGNRQFGSYLLMRQAVEASGTELVTVALRRVHLHEAQDDVIAHLQLLGVCCPCLRCAQCQGGGARGATGARIAADKLAETGDSPGSTLPAAGSHRETMLPRASGKKEGFS